MLQVSAHDLPLSTDTKLQQVLQHLCIRARVSLIPMCTCVNSFSGRHITTHLSILLLKGRHAPAVYGHIWLHIKSLEHATMLWVLEGNSPCQMGGWHSRQTCKCQPMHITISHALQFVLDIVAARGSAGAHTQAACGPARGFHPREEFFSCPGELTKSSKPVSSRPWRKSQSHHPPF